MKIHKVSEQDIKAITDPEWCDADELRFMTAVGRKYSVWNNVDPKCNAVVKVVEHPSINSDRIYIFQED